jgi:hypothetical protein
MGLTECKPAAMRSARKRIPVLTADIRGVRRPAIMRSTLGPDGNANPRFRRRFNAIGKGVNGYKAVSEGIIGASSRKWLRQHSCTG